MRQVALIPSGNHFNRCGVMSDGKSRYGYCSALAIYIVNSNTKQLEHLIAGYERAITSCSWSPHEPHLVVCASQDKTCTVWNIDREEAVVSIKMEAVPLMVQWSPLSAEIISIVTDDACVRIWSYKTNVALPTRDLDFSPIHVLRWSPKQAGVLASGHEDCTVAFYNHMTKKAKKTKSKERQGGVTDLQWDPLSDNYLLVAFQNGDIALFNSDEAQEIKVFERQSGGVQSLSWVKSAPGCFLAASGRHGVVRQWNVAQSSPEKAYKVGAGGVQNIVDIGKGRFLCSLADGSVGIYNSGLRRWDHQNSLSHSETVFDCEFKPSDPNVFATVSYDESARIWDMRGMQCKNVIRPDGGAIYSISWAPGDDDRFVVCTSSGKIFICDAAKGITLLSLTHHRLQAVRVSWNQADSTLIASTSADQTCTVFRPTGEIVKVFKHPAAVFGCHWSPFHQTLLATGCGDSMVRIVDAARDEDFQVILKGHTAKVFNVQFSPHSPDVIASGSDDCCIRVWSISRNESAVLAGHLNFVRALQWHHEIPFILISGSWDGCIRVWDTRTAVCLQTVMDHHADVYGLASHKLRPMFFASCSRDTTIRFWMTDAYCAAAKLLACSGFGWSDHVIGEFSQVIVSGAPTRLTGAHSAKLATKILEDSNPVLGCSAVAELFMSPDGSLELFDILKSMTQGRPCSFSNRVLHSDSVVSCLLSQAQELEESRTSHFSGVGKPSKVECLRAAATIYARLGYMKNYCDLMCEVGDWSEALACAPAVSLEYWQTLVQKRAGILAAENDLSAVPLYVASNNYQKAIDMHLARNDLIEAFSIAQSAQEEAYSKIASATAASPGAKPSEAPQNTHTQLKLRRKVVEEMSSQYCVGGNPTLGACCYLAIGDVDGAINTLLKGVEVEAALLLVRAVPHLVHPSVAATVYITAAKKAETLKMFNLAIQLLWNGGDGAAHVVEEIAGGFRGDTEAANTFYGSARLCSLSEYEAKGEAAAATDIPNAVKFWVLSRHYEQAALQGLAYLRRLLSEDSWCIDAVDAVLKWLTLIPFNAIAEPRAREIMGYAYGIGAFKASWHGFTSIVSPLVLNAKHNAKRSEEFVLKVEILDMLVLESIMQNPEKAVTQKTLIDTIVSGLPEELQKIAKAMTCVAQRECAQILPCGRLIPSATSRRAHVHSLFTGEYIQGPEFWISREEGQPKAISLADAVMWWTVCAFSPEDDGSLIQPL